MCSQKLQSKQRSNGMPNCQTRAMRPMQLTTDEHYYCKSSKVPTRPPQLHSKEIVIMMTRATLLLPTILWGCASVLWHCSSCDAFTPYLSSSPRTAGRPAAPIATTCAATGTSASSALFASTDAPDAPDADAKEELTPAKIGEMIEVTFVNGVMQLSQGFIDVLKLFIVAVKAAYEQGIPISSLLEEVAACPVQSANRPLMDEEVALRSSWTNVVYLVLERAGHGTDDVAVGGTIDEAARSKYGGIVNVLADAKRKQEEEGSKADKTASLTLDEIIEMGKSSGASFDGLDLDNAMDKAIAQQCLKVMKTVLTVLDEERLCYEEGGVGPALKCTAGSNRFQNRAEFGFISSSTM